MGGREWERKGEKVGGKRGKRGVDGKKMTPKAGFLFFLKIGEKERKREREKERKQERKKERKKERKREKEKEREKKRKRERKRERKPCFF